MNIVNYNHHGSDVFVREDLKGRHWEFCLCHVCTKLVPNSPNNCAKAQALFVFDKENDMVTPVWECPIFEEVKNESA